MARHMVICKVCNREFDAQYGASYDAKSRRYTCPSCVAAAAERTAANAAAKVAKRSRIIRIVAAFCAAGSLWAFPSFISDHDWGGAVFALMLALAALAVALWPTVKRHLRRDKKED